MTDYERAMDNAITIAADGTFGARTITLPVCELWVIVMFVPASRTLPIASSRAASLINSALVRAMAAQSVT